MQDANGETCLFYTLHSESGIYFQILKLLLESNAKVMSRNKDQLIPLQLTIKEHFIQSSILLVKYMDTFD